MNGKSSLKAALLAVQFLTIITFVPGLRASRQELTASMAFFPLVGLLLGGMCALFVWAGDGLFPPGVTGASVVALMALLTRGLHLDGLADTADAVGSGAPADKALEIMKDHCNGALGVAALVCILLLKAASASVLAGKAAWNLFLLIPCLSRFALNCLAASSGYARPAGGLGAAFCGRPVRMALVPASMTAAAAAWFLSGAKGIAVLVAVVLWSLLFAYWARRRFGGVTGDVLGAHVEISEALLFVLASCIV